MFLSRLRSAARLVRKHIELGLLRRQPIRDHVRPQSPTLGLAAVLLVASLLGVWFVFSAASAQSSCQWAPVGALPSTFIDEGSWSSRDCTDEHPRGPNVSLWQSRLSFDVDRQTDLIVDLRSVQRRAYIVLTDSHNRRIGSDVAAANRAAARLNVSNLGAGNYRLMVTKYSAGAGDWRLVVQRSDDHYGPCAGPPARYSNDVASVADLERAIVAGALFGLHSTTDAYQCTNDQYNVHGANASGVFGYQGGHSGHDVQTRNVSPRGDRSNRIVFRSLTGGEVIAAEGPQTATRYLTGSSVDDIPANCRSPEHVAMNDFDAQAFECPSTKIAVAYRAPDGTDRTVIYIHARQILVEVGDTVEAGDALGIMGMRGYAEGVHVHIEVHKGRTTDVSCGVACTPDDPVDVLWRQVLFSIWSQ